MEYLLKTFIGDLEMDVIGTPLTDEELEEVKHPFYKNSGTAWDLKAVADTINRGVEALSGSESLKEIDEGLSLLAGE